MKRLLLIPFLALPLLFVSCDGQTETPTDPVTPQFDVTAQGLATNTVQIQLRCARGVTGSVTVKLQHSAFGESSHPMNCITKPVDQVLFGGNPGSVETYSIADQNWSFGSCGSWKPSLLFQDVPGTRKCYVGTQEKGKGYLTIKVKYIKNP
jgi:hypothetical protein